MSAKAARQYRYEQAKNLAASLERILNRLNYRYSPNWLWDELEEDLRKAQSIQAECRRVMEGFGDTPLCELDSDELEIIPKEGE